MPQRKVETATNKNMNVIWHDHISPNANSTDLTFLGKTNQRRMHTSISKELLSIICVERHKVQRRIVTLKYSVETRRPVGHNNTLPL